MGADTTRFGWRWLVAAVDPDGHVTMLDPKKAQKRKEVRLGPAAEVDNVLPWL